MSAANGAIECLMWEAVEAEKVRKALEGMLKNMNKEMENKNATRDKEMERLKLELKATEERLGTDRAETQRKLDATKIREKENFDNWATVKGDYNRVFKERDDLEEEINVFTQILQGSHNLVDSI